MTRDSIMARFGGHVLALDQATGRELLAMDWPGAVVAGPVAAGPGLGVKIEPGERFAVSRGVAVMPLRGMLTPNSMALERYLGWSTYAGIEESCAALAADGDVQAVAIEADSPGGLVVGMAGAVDAVAMLASVKPVYVLVSPLAASAAYAIAAQGSEISVTAGGFVGSIGVMRQASAPVQPDMMGEKWGIYLSSHARAKWPDPQTDLGRAEIQRGLDAVESEFHGYVSKGRGIALDSLAAALSVTEDPADGGAVFGPADAIARGLADRVETRAEFYGRVFATHAPSAPPKAASRAFMAQAAAARAIADS